MHAPRIATAVVAACASGMLPAEAAARVTRRADVGHVACERGLDDASAAPTGAFPLVTASGNPYELVVPNPPPPGDGPPAAALARTREEAGERLDAFLAGRRAEILDRRDRRVVPAGQLTIGPRGGPAADLRPLDPASTATAPSYAPGADAEIRRLFRCRQSETETDIDPALVALLAEAAYFFQAPIELVSGYRARRFSRRRESRHIHGRAADVRIEGIAVDDLADLFTVLSDGPYGPLGVGRYYRSGFVHIDTRDETYFWTDRDRRRRRRQGPRSR
ncbi:MAG: DUF882 domain-containing protein [Myxococcota bacterium]|nr:DUF882 domain-containing protein [Myxococcota bacterium]